MSTIIDRPFQTTMSILLLVALTQTMGILLYLSGHAWGLLLTVGVAAAIQTLTLILVWYTLKLVFHMGRELVAAQANQPPIHKEN
ncbi:MAG: hypothetical protein A2498_05110 [Lentisphaerae bacterium RIFOXYC12_FULL_60_16]|nr:MAG: hypothetical protein A2498_05110 [Lentisphaerae bacterium RIFOXYC12_FULL_60_16]